MDESGGGEDAEDHFGALQAGVGQDVEAADEEEGENVLHVVEVSAADALNVGVGQRHHGLVQGGVLGVGKHL